MMHKLAHSLVFALALGAAAVASAGDVRIGVNVSGEVAPGVYGEVSIGNTRPVLVYEQPRIIHQHVHAGRPVYMHVPPGHAKKWDKHCHKYNACGRPVYFVKSPEYRDGGSYRQRDDDRRAGYRHDDRNDDRHDHRGHGKKDHDKKGHGNRGHGHKD